MEPWIICWGRILRLLLLVNIIEYVTIATRGALQDFGDMLADRVRNRMAAASSTRGLIAGGCLILPVIVNVIEYVTMTSLGDAIDFGDLH